MTTCITLSKVNKYVISYELDVFCYPGFWSWVRIVLICKLDHHAGSFGIFLLSFKCKVHGASKSFCGPWGFMDPMMVGNHCLMKVPYRGASRGDAPGANILVGAVKTICGILYKNSTRRSYQVHDFWGLVFIFKRWAKCSINVFICDEVFSFARSLDHAQFRVAKWHVSLPNFIKVTDFKLSGRKIFGLPFGRYRNYRFMCYPQNFKLHFCLKLATCLWEETLTQLIWDCMLFSQELVFTVLVKKTVISVCWVLAYEFGLGVASFVSHQRNVQ